MNRSCGILLPLTALPSDHGIGTMGKEARRFADFLARARQGCWQVLPLGPTSYGDSPYQSFSTFAGNPYLIDLELLAEEGLLRPEEYASIDWGEEPTQIDYGKVYENRFAVLKKAYARGWARDESAVAEFSEENREWLPDYALFMALKAHFGQKCWIEWPDEGARLHKRAALTAYARLLREDVQFYTYLQFLFFKQWEALRAYVDEKGIAIIGDLPIYVALDSADVWAHPELFELDEENLPTAVAGVPPDYFSADGQLWGNPLYRWDEHEKTGFAWWIARVRGAMRLYDRIRLDHFRGFASYYSIPYGEETARNGSWKKGPGMALFSALENALGPVEFLAEDLGTLTPDVTELLEATGYAGMRVLQFAFGGDDKNPYLPHNHIPHCVVYTGTHDNNTVSGWLETADARERERAYRYLNLSDWEGLGKGLARGALSSVAELAVAQMQDYLELPDFCRTNTPSKLGGNWRWRMWKEAPSDGLADYLAYMAELYGRALPQKEIPAEPEGAGEAAGQTKPAEERLEKTGRAQTDGRKQ